MTIRGSMVSGLVPWVSPEGTRKGDHSDISRICYLRCKKDNRALTGVAQWVERWPENQSVTVLIPSQGTGLGCGPGPQ